MKFNFEKHTEKETQKKVKENPELNQEQFEEQVLEEAEKLGTNIKQLKSEIDDFGGVEQFKKKFEIGDSSANVAGKELRDLSNDKEYYEKDAKKKAIWGTILTSATILGELGIWEIGKVTQNPEAGVIMAMVLTGIGTGALAIDRFVTATKQRVIARRKEFERQKQELKFKMTGVEPRI